MTDSLAIDVAGIAFQNPLVLAAGTAAYGRELHDVADLSALGGLVTKAVSPEPRQGAPSPRVGEFEQGMINAVGLANPGMEAVRATELPWLAAHRGNLRVLVNVVGRVLEDFAEVVTTLDGSDGFEGFELNVSCPNTRAGGLEFGADRAVLAELVQRARSATKRPLFVKLSPTLQDVATTAKVAVDAGATGITVVNTVPGLVIDVERRRTAVGFGSGGVSGSAILPVGVLATWRVSRATNVPVIGVGGVRSGTDVVQYLLAGASLVGVGTAGLVDPKRPEKIVRELGAWLDRHGVRDVRSLIGTLEWPV
ncbi:MAG TPA: dihydroorotate dehydrogenase [Gemmatimonadaceae bacterium]|nr:dihydroorotate dehydrogenase [Gemmatimonadaceae bacterium]